MDMEVNTEVFSIASSSLRKHCDIIEDMTVMLIKRLIDMKQNFDDVNYDRTMSATLSLKNQIVEFSGKISALEKDLKTLESLVYEYANGGYGR